MDVASLRAACAGGVRGWPQDREDDFTEAAKVAWADPTQSEHRDRPDSDGGAPPGPAVANTAAVAQQTLQTSHFDNNGGGAHTPLAADSQALVGSSLPHTGPGRLDSHTSRNILAADDGQQGLSTFASRDSDNHHSDFTSSRVPTPDSTQGRRHVSSGQARIPETFTHGESPELAETHEVIVSMHSDIHLSLADIDREFTQSNNAKLLHIYSVVNASGRFNFQQARVPLISNMHVRNWRCALEGYSDSGIVEYIEFGWPIGIDRSAPLIPERSNHASARVFPQDVEHYITTELKHAAMLGPFEGAPEIQCFQFSPLMTRPKRDSPFRRVIIDLSWPRGVSVNDAISSAHYIDGPMTISLPTVDDMERAVVAAGRGAYLYKTDLSRGYRQLRIDPLDWPYLAFTYKSMSFMDICPPFGLRSSAMAMQRVSQAIVYLHGRRGFSSRAYIDDFGGVEPKRDTASNALAQLQRIMDALGVKQAPAKICPPAQVMTWLGIAFDTLTMIMSIPKAKLGEIMGTVEGWIERTRASRREMQSLLGLLNFVAGVAPPARLFTNRMLDDMREAPPVGSTSLSLQFKQDVRFFADLLPLFNGRRVMGKCVLPYQHQVELDACLTGCGAVAGDQFYAATFPQAVLDEQHTIAHLEMLNVVVALKVWHKRWSGWTVQVYCDNTNTVCLLQSGRSRDCFMRACAREIFLYAAAYDVDIQACHRPGLRMIWADALSREHTHDKYRRFVQQDKHLRSATRIEVPHKLFDIVNSL